MNFNYSVMEYCVLQWMHHSVLFSLLGSNLPGYPVKSRSVLILYKTDFLRVPFMISDRVYSSTKFSELLVRVNFCLE